MSHFTCVCACICLCSIIHLAVSSFCDFETLGLCNWTYARSNQNQPYWLRTTRISMSGGGPLTDHTYNNESGYFLYLRGNETSNGIVAELKSETLNQPHTCLTFWYYMDGSEALALRLFLADGSSTLRELWNLSGNQGDSWRVHTIDVENDTHFNFVFKGETVDQGHVALDDISITGSCLDCDFEHECSNWDYKKTKWKIMTNNRKDPEYSFREGYFLALDSSECLDKHTLFSKVSTKPCRATLQFYFYLSGKNDTYINVYLQDNSKKTSLFENVGNSSFISIWKPFKMVITEAVGYKLFFEASRGKNSSGRVAVDDITLTYESCLNSDIPTGTQRTTDAGTSISSGDTKEKKTSFISTGTQRTTDAGTSISSGDTKENNISYGVYVGIAVGLAAILLIASIVTLILIRKRRQQASHKKATVLEMELETAKKQEMATTANNRPDGKVNQSHSSAHNVNTGDKKMCNLSSERKNIPCDYGKVDDVYNTTYESSSHVHDDETYDHITSQNMYDTTNIVKKNTIVDPTYDYTAKQETYVETQTMMKNALTDPTYDHAEKRFI